MNVAGHVAVAMRLHPDRPRVWLGAALPDIGAMGRFRLMGDSADTDVRTGIAVHHATDDAFHRHASFTGVMARLRSDLDDDGIGRGPARAVAHVGPELLIDGRLLDQDDVIDAIDAAFAEIENLGPALSTLVERDGEAWGQHLSRVAGWGLPTDYADPQAVARRLHRILLRRPRLAFPDDQVGPIGQRLAAEQPAIDDALPDLVDDLEATLSRPESADAGRLRTDGSTLALLDPRGGGRAG